MPAPDLSAMPDPLPGPAPTAGPARKAVFLDADGTLVNERGLIPQSAREAVAAARRNGHLVFLATGRSLSELWPAILEVGFDGLITAAGGYVELGGQVLRRQHIPVEHVARVMAHFDAHGVDYFLEANDALYGSPNCKDRLAEVIRSAAQTPEELAEIENGFGMLVEALQLAPAEPPADINKVSFLGSGLPLSAVEAEFAGVFDVIPTTVAAWGPNSGELAIPGVHKGAAIELVIDHLGIPIEDTIAFGDGLNDVEMLQLVAVGIAMASAHPRTRAVADAVTGDPDDHGIRDGFAELGLI